MSESEAVLSANSAFYAAFASRDATAMDEVWAREVPVVCIHPGWPPLTDRPQIMVTWHEILQEGKAPRIDHRNARAFVYGDTALVICEEALGDALLAATNLFVREAGSWRMVHHQAGPVAPGAVSAMAPSSGSMGGSKSGMGGGEAQFVRKPRTLH